MAGDDANHLFVTSPPVGSATRTRVWVLGDSGTASTNAGAVRDAYYSFTGSTHTNLWLMLGDNAYTSGTDTQYQAAVFDMYPTMLRKSVLWPTIGNHDTAGSSTDNDFPYLQIFSLPAGAEAGGMASGTEKYYSFNYANIHFICLDTMTSTLDPFGPMLTWLRNDLASNTLPWVIAYWHHPPYSKGSHDSDHEYTLEQIRQRAVPLLEDGGVDLVLTGHSHSYERSFLIDGHYGYSETFVSTMKVDGGNGRTDGTGAYRKGSAGPAPHLGAVYVVAGSSGHTGGGTLNHPAMFISLNQLGSMVLDIDGNRLEAKFLRETGAIDDYFTIIKEPAGPPTAPSNLQASAATSTRIDLGWSDNSTNEEGFHIERCSGTGCTTFAQLTQVGSGVTSFSDTTAAASSTYAYRVRAFASSGTSDYSNVAEGTTPAPPPPPTPPSDLTATATSSTQIALTWSDATNEEGYRVERCSGSCEAFAQVAEVAPNVTTFGDSGLAASTTYTYRVQAFNGAGSSDYSNTAVATTPAPPPPPSVMTFVAAGAAWKYLDNGTDQGLAWRAPSFDDAAWRSGPAQLGYGEGDEATVVSYGPDSRNKYITTYFRHSFDVTNASAFTSLTLRLLRDDGAVVYLNGVEIWRSNMPAGDLTYLTLSSSTTSDENIFLQQVVGASALVNGRNVLAVEIHQAARNSSDIGFDLELIGQ
jgi:hypothetical protein